MEMPTAVHPRDLTTAGRLRTTVAVLVAVFAFGPGNALGADATPQLTLVPTSITIGDSRPQKVVAILHNPAERRLRARLRWTNELGARVRVRGGNQRQARLAPGAEHAWTVLVTAGRGARPGILVFRANGAMGRAGRVSVASLELKAPPAPKLDDVTVETKTTLESLDEKHPGVVYLLVTNKSGAPIRILSVKGDGPTEATFTTPELPIEVSNRQTSSLPITVSVADRVKKGKYLLLFDLGLASKGPPTEKVHLVTTHQAQIGIPAESEVLTLLGLPSLLLVPGVLILAVATLLWRIPRPRPAGTSSNPPVEEKSIQFWVIAITFSILMAIVYPRLGGNDYLESYSLEDVVRVWFWSLVAGGVLYLVALVVAHVYAIAVAWSVTRRTPSADDQPVDLLRKLARQKLGLTRERYAFGSGTGTPIHDGYFVGSGAGEPTPWFSPPIVITLRPNAPDGDQLTRRLRLEESPSKLAELLELSDEYLDVAYEPNGGPTTPYTHDKASLGPPTDRSPMIRVQ